MGSAVPINFRIKAWLTIRTNGASLVSCIGEAAAGEQGNAHGGKIVGVGVGESAAAFNRAEMHAVAPSASAERDVGGHGSVLNTRDAAHGFDQLPFELCLILRLEVQRVEAEVANGYAAFAHARIDVS